MNWHKRNCFDPQYFADILSALQQHDFIKSEAQQSIAEQIGYVIVDRADQVLAANTQQDNLPPLAQKAIDAFEKAVEHFPEEVVEHFHNSAGTHAYKGLFCTRNLDIYSMWARIAHRTHSNWHSQDNWLHKLACALLRDSDFSTKLDEAAECCRLGLNRRETLARIEDHHKAMDSNHPSAKSLLMLDFL